MSSATRRLGKERTVRLKETSQLVSYGRQIAGKWLGKAAVQTFLPICLPYRRKKDDNRQQSDGEN